MPEHKPQTRYIPLKVRFRPATEAQAEREQNGAMRIGETRSDSDLERTTQSLPSLATPPNLEAERRIRQMKALLRLSDLLHADLDLDDVLQQITSSVAACTGFRVLTIHLLGNNGKSLSTVAVAGVSEADRRLMMEHSFPVEALFSLIRPQFRIGQSFFVPHQQMRMISESQMVTMKSLESENEKEPHELGRWHPDDNLVVPLYSVREQKLFGCLLLDDPEDERVPSAESIEAVELFANKAAVAIDNAYLFREREEERRSLEAAIVYLREDLELLREGDLRRHVRSTHKKLQPIADAINSLSDETSAIVKGMRQIIGVVDGQMHHDQKKLVDDTEEQEKQAQRIAQAVGNIAHNMLMLSDHSTLLAKTATDAVEITTRAQMTVDRAVDGMREVREATMQSARTMKTLSESGQEINETIMSMTDLTTRMHLLALNAAIEATRAGEQGQGFVLIAQEIRTLAQQCSEAARKVGTYIRTIQNEATTVSESVEQSTQQVVVQTELVMQTSVALEAISEVTDHFNGLVREVQDVANSQSQGSQQAVNSLNELVRAKSDVAGYVREMQQSMVRVIELTNALRSRITTMHPRER